MGIVEGMAANQLLLTVSEAGSGSAVPVSPNEIDVSLNAGSPTDSAVTLNRSPISAPAEQPTYDIIQVNGDGNCLFNAIAPHVTHSNGELYTPKELRVLSVNRIRIDMQNERMFATLHYDAEVRNEPYLTEMNKDGTYADRNQIIALAHHFMLPIWVMHSAQGATTIYEYGSNGAWAIQRQPIILFHTITAENPTSKHYNYVKMRDVTLPIVTFEENGEKTYANMTDMTTRLQIAYPPQTDADVAAESRQYAALQEIVRAANAEGGGAGGSGEEGGGGGGEGGSGEGGEGGGSGGGGEGGGSGSGGGDAGGGGDGGGDGVGGGGGGPQGSGGAAQPPGEAVANPSEAGGSPGGAAQPPGTAVGPPGGAANPPGSAGAAQPPGPLPESIPPESGSLAAALVLTAASLTASILKDKVPGPIQLGPIQPGQQQPVPKQPVPPVAKQPVLPVPIQPGQQSQECPNPAIDCRIPIPPANPPPSIPLQSLKAAVQVPTEYSAYVLLKEVSAKGTPVWKLLLLFDGAAINVPAEKDHSRRVPKEILKDILIAKSNPNPIPEGFQKFTTNSQAYYTVVLKKPTIGKEGPPTQMNPFTDISGEVAGLNHWWADLSQAGTWLDNLTNRKLANTIRALLKLLQLPIAYPVPKWADKYLKSGEICDEFKDIIRATIEYSNLSRAINNPYMKYYADLVKEKEALKGRGDDNSTTRLQHIQEELDSTYDDHMIAVRGGTDRLRLLKVPNPYVASAYREDATTTFASPGEESKFDKGGIMKKRNTQIIEALIPKNNKELLADKKMVISILESLWYCGMNKQLEGDPRCFPMRFLGELRVNQAARGQLAAMKGADNKWEMPLLRKIMRALYRGIPGGKEYFFNEDFYPVFADMTAPNPADVAPAAKPPVPPTPGPAPPGPAPAPPGPAPAPAPPGPAPAPPGPAPAPAPAPPGPAPAVKPPVTPAPAAARPLIPTIRRALPIVPLGGRHVKFTLPIGLRPLPGN